MKSVKMFGKSVPLIAIVLISFLAVGTAFAAYSIGTYHSTTTVVEPLEVVLLKGLPTTIYPGMGNCAIYLIHNKADYTEGQLKVTVTMNAPAGTELAGLVIRQAGSVGNNLIGADPVWIYGPDEVKSLTVSFNIGNYDYKGAAGEANAPPPTGYGFDVPGVYGWETTPESGGEVWTSAKGGSSFVKIYVGFKVLGDYDITVGPIILNFEVLRG